MATPLTSADPSDLANAATCFSSCIPPGLHLPLRTLHLSSVAVVATNPVCSTPSAPSALQVLNTSNTTIKVAWKQTKNTGSFITGYEVFWGTTNGGPYTSNSGVIGILPRNYTITGLSVGTTYFIVVVALTAIAGCQSVNSNQVSGTTSGTAPNTLLTSLVHYYQMETFAAVTIIDSVGATNIPALNAGADASLVVGKLGNCIQYTGAGAVNGLSQAGPNNTDFIPDTGIPQSYSCWFWFDVGQLTPTPVMFSFWDGAGAQQFGYFYLTSADSKVHLVFENAASAQISLDAAAALTDTAWHHFAGGYDAANAVLWMQLDNGVRQTTPMASIKAAGNGFGVNMFTLRSAGLEFKGKVDEWGVWHNRVLSTTDVANLWNGGAGLAFSQFQ